MLVSRPLIIFEAGVEAKFIVAIMIVGKAAPLLVTPIIGEWSLVGVPETWKKNHYKILSDRLVFDQSNSRQNNVQCMIRILILQSNQEWQTMA